MPKNSSFFAVLILAASGFVYAAQAERFSEWAAIPSNSSSMTNFKHYLAKHGVSPASLPPDIQLFRTASDWKNPPCYGPEFEVAPESHWEAAASTFKLLNKLQVEGILGEYEIASAYRNEALNECVHGAKKSTHKTSYAIDIVVASDIGPAICNYWKTKGQEDNMGLSRYSSGRIHIDVQRYRTWGDDHTSKTSFCFRAC